MGAKTRGARPRCSGAGVPIIPGTTEPVEDGRRGAAARRRDRLPARRSRRSAGGGGKGMKVVRLGRRGRARVRVGAARGRGVLRRRGGLRRALPRGSAARRGAGARRRARQRHPPRRARLHDPAAPPEARRGDAVAGGRRRAARADRRDRRRRRARGRLSLAPGRSRACSIAGRRLLLPGDEHAHPGRAHGHRAGRPASTSSASRC